MLSLQAMTRSIMVYEGMAPYLQSLYHFCHCVPIQVQKALYQVSIYARITQAASVSSSLTVTVDWLDSGVACAFSWPAVTGNTVSTVLVQPQIIVDVDGSSPVRYSTVYASAGGTVMQYKLAVVLSRVQA